MKSKYLHKYLMEFSSLFASLQIQTSMSIPPSCYSVHIAELDVTLRTHAILYISLCLWIEKSESNKKTIMGWIVSPSK